MKLYIKVPKRGIMRLRMHSAIAIFGMTTHLKKKKLDLFCMADVEKQQNKNNDI